MMDSVVVCSVVGSDLWEVWLMMSQDCIAQFKSRDHAIRFAAAQANELKVQVVLKKRCQDEFSDP